MLRALLLTLIPLLWPLGTQAQTQAACTFKFFSPATPLKLSDGTPVLIQPVGINDFGTIVGVGSTGSASSIGLIRWANGGFTHVKGTEYLTARNDHGTSVGFDLTGNAVLVSGSTITPVVIDVNNGGVFPRGINRNGTIIGQYAKPNLLSNHGFKRFKNGTTHILEFPGAVLGGTQPAGINDDGTVVGSYFGSDRLIHGFIFHNGQWATLDYPHSFFTALVGITNTGKIIGIADGIQDSSRTPFLYENGAFKVISVPNSAPRLVDLRSISPKLGLILGVTDDRQTSQPAFIAQCQ
jgi:hypothetical protein